MNEELGCAVEVFVTAITQIRALYRPHVCDRIGDLYVMRDPPGKKNPRKTEIVAAGLSADRVVEQIHQAELGWHYLCDIQPDESSFDAIRSEYKALGYRALSTEWMFVHNLRSIPNFTCEPYVRRVTSQEQADSIPQLAAHKLKLAPDTRDFMVWDEMRDYGRVRSVDIGNSCWVQGLHVHEDVRRRGYGKALMSALLHSDCSLEKEKSVLLASTAGATVYPLLGYRQIGVLQLLCPVRR